MRSLAVCVGVALLLGQVALGYLGDTDVTIERPSVKIAPGDAFSSDEVTIVTFQRTVAYYSDGELILVVERSEEPGEGTIDLSRPLDYGAWAILKELVRFEVLDYVASAHETDEEGFVHPKLKAREQYETGRRWRH
jgi:hypothetical protein